MNDHLHPHLTITHIKNAHVFAPDDLGIQEAVIVGQRLYALGHGPDLIQCFNRFSLQTVDLDGGYLIPGLVDVHVHFIGGGGEAGPQSRTPEIQLSHLTSAGITSAAGVLGTDSTTRCLTDLLTKARSLEEDGLTTRMYSGAYRVPTPTLCGSIERDLVVVDKVVGAKTAISDHRSSHPSLHELRRMASECRIGGLLSGKPGVLHLHVGSGSQGLDPLFELLERSEIPAATLYPTHVNRNHDLLDQAAELTRRGSWVDLTADEGADQDYLYIRKQGARSEHITISSDGNASEPRFDADGILTGFGVARATTLLRTLRALSEHLPLDDCLPAFTTVPARALGLRDGQGTVRPGGVADLVSLDPETFAVNHVWLKGELVISSGQVQKGGMFE